MNRHLKKFKLDKPLHDLFPWKHFKDYDNLEFRNMQHFINIVGELQQKRDTMCGISYEDAFKQLRNRTPRISPSKQKSIRNLVKQNLHKRGLLSEEIYENFKYAEDGTCVGIDVGKYAAGEPDCIISPNRHYVDFFYELFINISYPYGVLDQTVVNNAAKLLATIEELERQHIFIKITLVLPVKEPAMGRNMFLSIPVFDHREYKDVGVMSSVFNERLLRKFVFAVMEDLYGSDLYSNYGKAVTLTEAINLGRELNEIEIFENIRKSVGIK